MNTMARIKTMTKIKAAGRNLTTTKAIRMEAIKTPGVMVMIIVTAMMETIWDMITGTTKTEITTEKERNEIFNNENIINKKQE